MVMVLLLDGHHDDVSIGDVMHLEKSQLNTYSLVQQDLYFINVL